MITLYEQVDKTDQFRYSWILDGVSGRRGHERRRLEEAGWKWVSGGRRGCYVTNDYALATQTGPHVFGIKLIPVSNGSHALHNAPMYEKSPSNETHKQFMDWFKDVLLS